MEPSTSIVYTYDDYLTLPNDGKRYEIIEGELYMTPAPMTHHQEISGNLEHILRDYLSASRWGKLFHAPIDVVFSMTEIVQPDIIVISKQRQHIITKKNIVAAPDLVIEILSESSANTDRTTKKALYEKHGVKEYWIVDPVEQAVELYVRKENAFSRLGVFSGNQIVESQVLRGLKIEVREIFSK